MVNQPTRPEDRQERVGFKADYAVHTAVVVNNVDSLYSGRLQVWVPAYGGDPTKSTSWVTVQYANPFYGITSYSGTQRITGQVTASQFRANEANPFTAGYMDTAKKQGDVNTFGMWTQPPEIGTKVLIVFADGDVTRGYWFAAIPEVAHGMIPAIGKGASGQPEAEFDPASGEVQTQTDIRQVQRPPHPIAATYQAQGLDADPLRGFISTSSFRESPSRVMGFNTPGGHTFAMDDGDEGGTTKLIRLRTAAGNQITMHDDTGMIYLINAKGTAWFELSPSGHVDVYAEAGLNLATKGDLNLHSDKNVNIHAGENLKLVGMKGTKIQGTEEMLVHGKKTMIEGVDSLHIHSCKEIIITSFKDIFIKAFNWLVVQGKCFRWNTGTAKEAEQVPPEKPEKVDDYDTTVKKAPNHEPYKNHDGGGGATAGTGTTPAGAVQPGSAAAQAQGRGGAVPPTGQDPALRLVPGSASFDPSAYAAKYGNDALAQITGPGRGFVVEQPGARAAAINAAAADRAVAAEQDTASTTPTTSVTPSEFRQAEQNPFTAGSLDTAANAQNAVNQLAGQNPMSSIPAGAGGGATGFAKGNNCERPADGGGNGLDNGATNNDPAATQSCAECFASGGCSANEAALLDTLAGPESKGAYNIVNYVAGGGSPKGFEVGAGHPYSGQKGYTAAGRYQILSSNHERLGGGDFGKLNQDQTALKLAAGTYGSSFASDVASGNIQFNKLTDWTTTSQDSNASARFQNNLAKYQSGGSCAV